MRSVVITGTALATPAGYTLDSNITAWNEGIATFSEIPNFADYRCPVRYTGMTPKPDVSRLPDKKVQKILRTKDIVGLITVLNVIEHAGLAKNKPNPDRFGMFVGTGSTRLGDLQPFHELVGDCVDLAAETFNGTKFGAEFMTRVNPLVLLQTLMNNTLCYATMTLDARGVNANFMDFQLGGLRAVGEGFRAIQEGRADVIVAGGVAGPVEPFQLAEGVETGYLAGTAHTTVDPRYIVKPWDINRAGTILSDGAAFVVLESEDHALERSARILGKVHGWSMANDPGVAFLQESSAPAVSRAMRGALRDAAWQSQDLGFVVGYGNGSSANDLAELRAYRDLDAPLPLVSPKGVLGDLCEASGVVSLILALSAFEKSVVPPTFNCTQPITGTSFTFGNIRQEIVKKRALITCRNFMGSTAALAVGQS